MKSEKVGHRSAKLFMKSTLVHIFSLFHFSLSIWNTMMGTSLLSVPWALSQSGLIMGLAIAIGMSLIAAYTASIILKTHSKESKYGCFYTVAFLTVETYFRIFVVPLLYFKEV